MTRSMPRPALVVAAALFASLGCAPGVQAARHERPIESTFAESRAFEVENLAGAVIVRPAAGGGEVRVTGTVVSEAASAAAARALAEKLEVEVDRRADRTVVRLRYPEEYRRFCYPARGKSGEIPWPFAWFDFGSSNFTYLGRRVAVVGRPASDAPVLYVDLRIEVPRGVAVKVRNAVGNLDAEGIVGDQTFDTSSGEIRAREGRGRLVADTGSGGVTIADHRGDVSADTGSGDVRIERTEGSLVTADTGSGRVELVAVRGSIDADTGSGDIVGRDLVAGARVHADTGSGSVRLAGDFSAVRDLEIDTGSGDVALTMSRLPGLKLAVSTGSGDIDVDLPATRLTKRSGEFVAEIGDAGGRGVIDTGSGDVTIRTSP